MLCALTSQDMTHSGGIRVRCNVCLFAPGPLPPWGPRRLAGVHIPSLPTGAVRAAASASPVSPRRLHSWRSAVWAIWADVLVRSEDGLVTTLLLIRRVHLPSEPRPPLEQRPAGASRAPANTRL